MIGRSCVFFSFSSRSDFKKSIHLPLPGTSENLLFHSQNVSTGHVLSWQHATRMAVIRKEAKKVWEEKLLANNNSRFVRRSLDHGTLSESLHCKIRIRCHKMYATIRNVWTRLTQFDDILIENSHSTLDWIHTATGRKEVTARKRGSVRLTGVVKHTRNTQAFTHNARFTHNALLKSISQISDASLFDFALLYSALVVNVPRLRSRLLSDR